MTILAWASCCCKSSISATPCLLQDKVDLVMRTTACELYLFGLLQLQLHVWVAKPSVHSLFVNV